jgi:hypothetical protein
MIPCIRISRAAKTNDDDLTRRHDRNELRFVPHSDAALMAASSHSLSLRFEVRTDSTTGHAACSSR